MLTQDTIVACATAPGKGGVAIIRISGTQAATIALKLTQRSSNFQPRYCHFQTFYTEKGHVLDEGVAIHFPAPKSFTGEDVVEIQGHGSPVVVNALISEICAYGARIANPGEFSERAFLNDKIDLAQAEAIADLINSSTIEQAQASMQSLHGVFSNKVNSILDQLIHTRMWVESAIDFAEEEIDFLADSDINKKIKQLYESINDLLEGVHQGKMLRDGLKIAIVGKPNAGKSTLFNQILGQDRAIVTDIEGTTRDTLSEFITIEGFVIELIDTAGLRITTDQVEQIGIERSTVSIEQADLILLLGDSAHIAQSIRNDIQQNLEHEQLLSLFLPAELQNLSKLLRTTKQKTLFVLNKSDLLDVATKQKFHEIEQSILLSAKNGEALDLLLSHIAKLLNLTTQTSTCTARARHTDALSETLNCIQCALQNLQQGYGELVAEDLTQAQRALSSVTGVFTTDDLLGQIFSNFCVGK